MFSKQVISTISTFVVAAVLLGCGSGFKGNQSQDTVPAPANSPTKPGYQKLTAEDLYQSQFKSVELFCSAYIADKTDIPAEAKPAETYRFQVYPQVQQASGTVLSETGRFQVVLRLTPVIS